MRLRLLTMLGLSGLLLGFPTSRAWAVDDGGQNGSLSVGASTGPGAVQVYAHASGGQMGPGGSLATQNATAAAGSGQTLACPYQVLPSADQDALAPGGPTPGVWEAPTCYGIGTWSAIWVPSEPTHSAQGAPSPALLAQEAMNRLGLGVPRIEMAPPDGSSQLVGVASWLWVDPGEWRARTASASAGPVTSTATARPSKVVWDMGDGDSVTCGGPGTPYSAADPDASTDCSYTWPAPGSFTVTATVYWAVTWTATGAAGGGNLGVQAGLPAQVQVAVTESQAINTSTGGRD